MEICCSLNILIDILGVLQGLVLGISLLFIKGNRKSSSIFLALFIIVYALQLLPQILFGLGFITNGFYLAFPFINFGWLLFPLFFVYAQKVSILSEKIIYWPLKLGLIFLTVGAFICFYGMFIMENAPIVLILFNLLEPIFGVFVGVKIVLFVNNHLLELKNQYSSLESKELLWVKYYALIGIFFMILHISSAMLLDHYLVSLSLAILNVGLLYWVSLRGIYQRNIKSVISTSKSENNSYSAQEAIPQKTIIGSSNDDSDSEMIEIIRTSDEYLEETQIFTEPNLSIHDISIAISVHPKRLSTSINKQLKINFSNYINDYRIEKAMLLLKDDNYSNLSVEGIGSEVGFQSKSAFHIAFKRKTGTTPSDFKKSN